VTVSMSGLRLVFLQESHFGGRQFHRVFACETPQDAPRSRARHGLSLPQTGQSSGHAFSTRCHAVTAGAHYISHFSGLPRVASRSTFIVQGRPAPLVLGPTAGSSRVVPRIGRHPAPSAPAGSRPAKRQSIGSRSRPRAPPPRRWPTTSAQVNQAYFLFPDEIRPLYSLAFPNITNQLVPTDSPCRVTQDVSNEMILEITMEKATDCGGKATAVWLVDTIR
jgi:hypothetical protein